MSLGLLVFALLLLIPAVFTLITNVAEMAESKENWAGLAAWNAVVLAILVAQAAIHLFNYTRI